MAEFPAAQPHGPIREVFPDLFVVRGMFRIAPMVAITRNMAILRHAGELTLINSVRLGDDGIAELKKLGTPRNLVRLGQFHGMDDPWYHQEMKLTYWASPDASARLDSKPDVPLVAGGPSPVPGTELFTFSGKKPEFALLVPREGGILISCDSVQNWDRFEGSTFLGKVVLKAMGFGAPGQIGPMWKKELEGDRPNSLKPDFDRLLALEWRHLISGHGEPLRDTAKEALRGQVAKMFT